MTMSDKGEALVPDFDGVSKRKLDGLLERGWEINGYSLYQNGDHGLITTGGFVGWFSVTKRNEASAQFRIEALSAKLKEAEAALERISDVKYPDVDTIYAHRAMIDYARGQARLALHYIRED